MAIVTFRSGRYFSSEPRQSLLAAAEAAGMTLPYSCRSGRCSTCKCKVMGATEVLIDENGLSAEEKAEGWVLACARSAEADVTLDIQDLSELNLPEKKIIPAKIDSLELLSRDVMEVKLRLPPGRTMEFMAGQYADVIGPGGIRRSYSFAAAPQADGVEFQIRRIDGGAMSAYWFDEAKVNDLLRVDGPRGTFVLRHKPQTDVVFLATGTGIAPVKSMVEWIAIQPENLKPHSIKVFWGSRSEEDLYWEPSGSLDRFNYHPVLSRASKSWGGARGYVQDVLLAMNTDLTKSQVYACGSDGMIKSAKLALTSNGLAHDAFFSDAFVASN